MTPFVALNLAPAVLAMDNVDTDQLIPARFMRKPRSAGYGPYLLHDLRFNADGTTRDDFPLNARIEPPIILFSGRNFGCGSSREAAVYALLDFGVRTVVADGFADIFYHNAVRNGLLPVSLPPTQLADAIASAKAAPGKIHVDLAAQIMRFADRDIRFDFDQSHRRKLLLGLDAIGETLEHEKRIAEFEAVYLDAVPWSAPRRG